MKTINPKDLEINPKKVANLSEGQRIPKEVKADISPTEKCPDKTVRCHVTDEGCKEPTFESNCMCYTNSCKEEECASIECTKSTGAICCEPPKTGNDCPVLFTVQVCKQTQMCIIPTATCDIEQH